MRNNKYFTKEKHPGKQMVKWFDPIQLILTAGQVVISTILGQHVDRRLNLDSHKCYNYFDYSNEKTEDCNTDFWFDYVADTGDGWNSTYAVAEKVAQEFLNFSVPGHDKDLILRRGRFLLFGGDEVYPSANLQEYEERLQKPYCAAFSSRSSDTPDVFAIPGNHDWYDSLSAFRRIFCKQRMFAGWKTRQTRSYFAIRLPRGWWLFGVDMQLHHDIDDIQMDYFSQILQKEVHEKDRIILCAAEPFWISFEPRESESRYDNIKPLIRDLWDLIGPRLSLAIAGDLHHYRRHSNDKTEQHLITCGTGGAFLHPTHCFENEVLPQDFTLKKSYPDTETSRKLTWGNTFFLFKNLSFGIIPATIYLLISWANGIYIGETFSEVSILEIGHLGLTDWPEAIEAGFHSALLNPVGMILYFLLFSGFLFFTKALSGQHTPIFAIFHAMAHVIAGFLIYWFAAYITLQFWPPKSIPQYLMAGVIIFFSSWIIASTLLGTYLLIALNVYGHHRTEAFSSLKIEDWKGFVRINISKDGTLTLYFIGLRVVPKQWCHSVSTDNAGSQWISADRKATPAEIIDIAVVRSNSENSG